jgi:hypothetical protein
MCQVEVSIYRCGHQKTSNIRRCQSYYEKKAESGVSICKLFASRHSRHCGHLVYVDRDDRSVCSTACAAKLLEKRKREEKELARRERENYREYEKNKKREEEALRRQRKERERNETGKRTEPRGESEQYMLSNPGWQTAYGTDVQMTAASQPPMQGPHLSRADTRYAPPRLSERAILPQAYCPQQPPSASSSSLQANNDLGGRNIQGAREQPRMPLISNDNGQGSSISRSNGRRLRQQDVGTPRDPRTRLATAQRQGQARAELQPPAGRAVTARTPVTVSPRAGIPQASRARISTATPSSSSTARTGSSVTPTSSSASSTCSSALRERVNGVGPRRGPTHTMAPSRVEYQYFGPPVPPKDVPSFPPEDQEGSWYPQHPDMAPAPLSLRSKAQNNAPRPLARQQANGHLDGYKPDPLMTIPSRKPVQVSTTTATYPRAPPTTVPRRKPVGANTSAPRATAPESRPGVVPGYRPNPMFDRRNRSSPPAEVSPPRNRGREKQKIDGSTRQRAQQQQQQQQQQPRPGGGGPQPQPRPNRSQARSSTTSQSSGSKNKKPSWLKRLVGAPSTASLDSVEFVSLDAARIERSLTPRRGP